LLQAVSERLVQRGHDVTVLTFDCATMRDFTSPRGAGLPARETLNGVKIIRINPQGGRLVKVHQWWLRKRGGWRSTAWLLGGDAWPIGLPSGLATVLPLARLSADVVSSTNWHFGASFWTCLPRHLRRVPRVAVPILHIEQQWAKKPIYSRMVRNCDAAIVCTEAEGDFLRALGGTSITVAGAGVEPLKFANRNGARVREEHGLGRRPVVGFVGRQDVHKGVPTLVDAMRMVWPHYPDAVLLMAGQHAHRDNAVTEKLASLRPHERRNVLLIDDFADADGPSIMDACDLLALPSVEESFGLVLVEAWMCEKPVIGADIAATRCIIDAGIDGLTVKPFDADDLSAKILDLLADPKKRELFGRRGRDKVLARYTWERVTDAWERTFVKVAKGRP
jgi:glycosyltransferase involved in cell wall biosynthesis